MLPKERRPEGQDLQILRHMSPTQSHQSNGAAETSISTVRGLPRTYLTFIKDKITSCHVSEDQDGDCLLHPSW